MQAKLNERANVSAVIVDGQTIRPGDVATLTRRAFKRVNARKVLLLEVEERGGDEPSGDEESQEDN